MPRVREATGDLLVFADTFQKFDPGAFSALADALGDPRVGAVSGLLELPPSRDKGLMHDYWNMEIALRRSEATLHFTIGAFGPIWAMRRELWQGLPAGLILDDVYTPMRLVMQGWRVAFAEDANATDLRRPELGSEFRRKVRTQTGIFQLIALLPGLLNPARNPVMAMFLFHKVGRLATPPLVLTMLGASLAWLFGHVFLVERAWWPR